MTGGSLIALAPWAVFVAGLTVVWLRLRRARRSSRRTSPHRREPQHSRAGREPAGGAGAARQAVRGDDRGTRP